jgi:hypothetical protein
LNCAASQQSDRKRGRERYLGSAEMRRWMINEKRREKRTAVRHESLERKAPDTEEIHRQLLRTSH